MALALQNAPTLFTAVQDAPIAPFTISGTGGATPYTYSAVGLPAGVAVDFNEGIVSGTPTVNGNFAVTFEVVDADSSIAYAESEFAILADTLFTPGEFSEEVPQPVPNAPVDTSTIHTPRQQFWVVGKAIVPVGLVIPLSANLTGPYVYSAGWLPPGISISSTTGLLSGTPVEPLGASEIVLYVADAVGVKYANAFGVEINSSAADSGQEDEQSGMLMSVQNPGCLGVSTEIPETSVQSAVTNAQAAYVLAGYLTT
jgi:hypothetical protein